MRINFFEEYPNEESLSKAKLIDFPSTIFMAAKSIKDFLKLKKELNKINPKLEAAYWPIINRSYWISPFSHYEDLFQLFEDLEKNKQKKKLKILLDLELPLKLKLYKNIFSFNKNKKLIKKFFEQQQKLNLDIHTAEYPITNRFLEKSFQWLGVNYPLEKYPHKKIMMYYTSMSNKKFLRKMSKNAIIKKKSKYGNKFQVALGTTAIGVLGNEPKITYQNLEKDFKFVQSKRIKTVTIFRLEGLDKKYLNIIHKFLKK